eukprot:1184681-Prorocentrum_minimum.AAC.4
MLACALLPLHGGVSTRAESQISTDSQQSVLVVGDSLHYSAKAALVTLGSAEVARYYTSKHVYPVRPYPYHRMPAERPISTNCSPPRMLFSSRKTTMPACVALGMLRAAAVDASSLSAPTTNCSDTRHTLRPLKTRLQRRAVQEQKTEPNRYGTET